MNVTLNMIHCNKTQPRYSYYVAISQKKSTKGLNIIKKNFLDVILQKNEIKMYKATHTKWRTA